MSLFCGEPDLEDCEWMYIKPNNYITYQAKKRKRCKSCGKLIDPAALCLKFDRFRYPKDEIECRIHGGEDTEINIAPYYMCEACGDQFFNLSALGFCIDITKNMFDLLKDYQHDFAR